MEHIGRFELGAEIDRGPLSVTYEAEDSGTPCVLQVIAEDAVPVEPGLRAGLVKALEGLKAIEHPSIVRVLDAGEADGRVFIASERMRCATLQETIAEAERLEEQQVVLFVRQMAQALDKDHGAGYCHGDLNARNVFVVSPEKVKLSAFAVKALLEEPPDASALDAEAGEGEGGEDWLTAEDLLRSKSRRLLVDRVQQDLVGLAVLMLNMLGYEVPERDEDEALVAYREYILDQYSSVLTDPATGVGARAGEVARRLLTTGGFESPGEVVVELASAMLVGRGVGRSRPVEDEASPEPEEPAAAEAPAAEGGLAPLEFKGDSRTADFTPFFVWTDRRGGRFLIIHDGERLAIGRDPDVSDWTLMDPAISRRHCYLSKENGVLRVQDLGSSNGTFVNGERVEEAEVGPSDELRVGTTRFLMGLADRE